MKKSFFLIPLLFSTFLLSCNKMEINPPEMIDEMDITGNMTIGDVLYEGDFSAAAHPTSGKVQIISVDGFLKLVLTDFKTDSGPDLRLYMAEDKDAKNYTEINNKIPNGSWVYNLPISVNPEKQKYVLVWCKAFSVSFGGAELTKVE